MLYIHRDWSHYSTISFMLISETFNSGTGMCLCHLIDPCHLSLCLDPNLCLSLLLNLCLKALFCSLSSAPQSSFLHLLGSGGWMISDSREPSTSWLISGLDCDFFSCSWIWSGVMLGSFVNLLLESWLEEEWHTLLSLERWWASRLPGNTHDKYSIQKKYSNL